MKRLGHCLQVVENNLLQATGQPEKHFRFPRWPIYVYKLTNISPTPISALNSCLTTNIAREKKPSVKGKTVFFLISKPFVSGVTRAVQFEAGSKVAKIERTIGLSVSQAEEPFEKVSCIRMLGHQQQLISINMKQPILSWEWRYF